MLSLLKRNLLLFSYALAFWLVLITLDVSLGFNGAFAGFLFWVTLLMLFLALWYTNLPLVKPCRHELIRFIAIFSLALCLTVVFILLGFFVGLNYKLLIGGGL